MNNRNTDLLEHIVRYCGEIMEARKRFGDSFKSLQSDTLYRNAVSMCILQIGELSSHLSTDFKMVYNEMPWRDIRGMRNIAAHHYGKFDVKKLWETITSDIPALSEYCEKILHDMKSAELQMNDTDNRVIAD